MNFSLKRVEQVVYSLQVYYLNLHSTQLNRNLEEMRRQRLKD
jgi:hypothetical protein